MLDAETANTTALKGTSSTVGDSVASEGKHESKADVFEALLVEHLNGIVFGGQIDDEKGWIVRWRDRYAKADTYEYGYHDVEDLYESPTEGLQHD